MLIGSVLQIYPFDFKPSAPPTGAFLFYAKTDNTLYIQDSTGIEYAFGSTTAITELTGEATGIGPGVTAVTLSNSAVIGKILTGFTASPNSPVLATDTILQAIGKLQAQVNSVAGTSLAGDVTGSFSATVVALVGGKTATQVAQAVDDVIAATSSNTASTLVERDASGNFSANVITANLIGTASGNEPPIVATTAADYYRGDKTFQPLNKAAVGLGNVDNTSDINKPVSTAQAAADAAVQAFSIQRANHTGTQAATTIGAGTVSDTEFGYLDGVTSPIQTQIDNIGPAITDLTGDVSATGPGSTVATVNSVGGSSAANINAAELLANAATDANTPSTIVKRDASGNFSVGLINSIDISAHGSRHNPSGADPLAVGTPVQISTSNFLGAANSYALSDHVHSHGNQSNGLLHAVVTTLVNGFMSFVDKVKLDAATDANTASTIVMRDASGNFSAGTITADLTGSASNNLLKAGDSMTGYFRTAVVALTDGPTINTDASLGNVFTVTIAGNRTFAAPTNPLADQKITYKIRQDATGGRVITWDAAFNFGVDLSGVPNSTSPNVFDYYGFQYDSTTSTWHCLAISRGY